MTTRMYTFNGGGCESCCPQTEMITTDTAYGYFIEGTTQLAGVCRIKNRVAADNLKLLPPTSKVQYLGTPLVLGTADVFHPHADLRRTMVAVAIDRHTDSTHTIGPWSAGNAFPVGTHEWQG